MSDQLSFLEEPPQSRPTDGLFFALFLSGVAAAMCRKIGEQQQTEHGLKGKLHAQDRLHLSLVSLGEHRGLPERTVALAREAAAAVDLARFELSFDRVESFLGKAGSYPLVLRCGEGLAGLTGLHQAVVLALKKVGLGKGVKPLDAPHVTLMYADRRIETQRVEPIRWTVSEFVLVHSLLGQTIYKPLGRWPLRG